MRDLVYNGTAIREREEMMNLTDMWRAAGSQEGKRPDDWKKDSANRVFLDHVALISNAPMEGIWIGRRGAGGGTFAHWQVALAYAKYLSPEFHVWCNTVVREHMQGRVEAERQAELELAPPTFSVEGITKADLRTQCEWISKRLKAMDERHDERLWEAIKQVVGAVWHAKGSLNRSLLSPEHLAEQGVILLPAPTPDTTFLTATQVCWRVIPDERLHKAVPGIIGRQLLSHARQHQWPQGQTPRLSKRDRPMPTYPESRVEEWLAAGGAATIEHENDWQRRSDAVEAGAIPLQQTA